MTAAHGVLVGMEDSAGMQDAKCAKAGPPPPPALHPSSPSPCTSQASLPRRPAGRSSEGDGVTHPSAENERGALGGDVRRA